MAAAELVACIEEEEIEIERCPYTTEENAEATLIRVQVQAVVTLREAQTGEVVAVSDVIMGDLPDECQVSEQFRDGELTKNRSGGKPMDDVEAWLTQYVEIP